jgi:hypothetical protein
MAFPPNFKKKSGPMADPADSKSAPSKSGKADPKAKLAMMLKGLSGKKGQ